MKGRREGGQKSGLAQRVYKLFVCRFILFCLQNGHKNGKMLMKRDKREIKDEHKTP